jgi:Concanavalin A-like lectin/glucanases superfamily/PEP-CTERM motif
MKSPNQYLPLFVVLAISISLGPIAKAQITGGLVGRYLFNGNGNNSYGTGSGASLGGNFSYLPGGGVQIFGDASERTSGGGFIQLPMSTFSLSDSFTLNIAFSNIYQTFGASEPLFSWGVATQSGSRLVQINAHPAGGGVGLPTVVGVGAEAAGTFTGVGTSIATNFFNSARYITAVKASNSLSLYLDGILVGTTNSEVPLPTDATADIGRHYWVQSGGGTSTRLDASVYRVEVYNRALSSTEVAQVVPEPSTYTLLLLGGAGALLWAKRRRC